MERRKTENFERSRLTELKSRLLEHERSMKEERYKLWESEKDLQQGPFVWQRLEVRSMDILGYVSQVTTEGYMIKDPQAVISHLHRLSIFDIECIMKWYPNAAQEYPKIKEFFELLDYIRLLVLDYIQRYRLQEELTSKLS